MHDGSTVGREDQKIWQFEKEYFVEGEFQVEAELARGYQTDAFLGNLRALGSALSNEFGGFERSSTTSAAARRHRERRCLGRSRSHFDPLEFSMATWRLRLLTRTNF